MFGGKSWYTSVDQMLDKAALDGVMIVGPPELHCLARIEALYGADCPLSWKNRPPRSGQRKEMVATANAKKTFLMTGFMKRHGLTYGKIREFIQSGRFAQFLLDEIHALAHDRRKKRSGRNAAGDVVQGTAIDLVLSFFGLPKRLQCTMTQGFKKWITLGINMTFDGGRMAELMLGSQAHIQERFEMSGTLDSKAAFFVVDNVVNMELHARPQRHRRAGSDDGQDQSKLRFARHPVLAAGLRHPQHGPDPPLRSGLRRRSAQSSATPSWKNASLTPACPKA